MSGQGSWRVKDEFDVHIDEDSATVTWIPRSELEDAPWFTGLLDEARCIKPACTHGKGFPRMGECEECDRIQREACERIGQPMVESRVLCNSCGRRYSRTCTCAEDDLREGIECLCFGVRLCPDCFTEYAEEQG